MEDTFSVAVLIFFAILGLGFVLAMAAGMVLVLSYSSRQKRKAAALKRNGIRGDATILDFQVTPTDSESDDIAWLRLNIQVPGIAPYVLEKRAPLRYAGLLKKGMLVAVWVDEHDPQNPDGVEVEIQSPR